MEAEEDVVLHDEGAEQSEVLERAADAERRDAVHRHIEQRHIIENDAAAVGLIDATEAIEQGGLAGAVRADDAADLAAPHVKTDIVERDDAPETHAETADTKQRRLRRPLSCGGGGLSSGHGPLTNDYRPASSSRTTAGAPPARP